MLGDLETIDDDLDKEGVLLVTSSLLFYATRLYLFEPGKTTGQLDDAHFFPPLTSFRECSVTKQVRILLYFAIIWPHTRLFLSF